MGSRNTSVALSDHFIDFAHQQVETGRFGSTSDVVRAGLRLLEERQQRIDRLNALLDEGEASGFIDDFDFDAYIAAIDPEANGTARRSA